MPVLSWLWNLDTPFHWNFLTNKMPITLLFVLSIKSYKMFAYYTDCEINMFIDKLGTQRPNSTQPKSKIMTRTWPEAKMTQPKFQFCSVGQQRFGFCQVQVAPLDFQHNMLESMAVREWVRIWWAFIRWWSWVDKPWSATSPWGQPCLDTDRYVAGRGWSTYNHRGKSPFEKPDFKRIGSSPLGTPASRSIVILYNENGSSSS